MGEVYRASDTRLGRNVAIKVLPELFALDPERVARFEREARLLASLNHPNIAGLHGLEPADGKFFLVMELVEGETLAQRIQRSPVPVEEALGYARQIAEALEAAHEKGVIHRDLKPANIKITPDGKIKVLDFGLAKAMDPGSPLGSSRPDVTHSPTLSLNATFAGVILGTAPYMAPEQAKGAATDQRSDIFAFGCVLYEMLSGRQAFTGDTATEILASVLKSEADLTLLPPQLNPRLTELIRRCLAKDPKRRWHAAADLRMEIEAILQDPHGLIVRAGADGAGQPLWKRALPFVATAIIVAGVSAAVMWNLRPAPAPLSIARFSIVLPDGQQLTRTGRHNIAISPDGQSIVYVADNQLYLRTMRDIEARPIQGTNQDVNTPFFSPDGKWIGFYAVPEAKFKKIAITGGTSVTIADFTNTYGAEWGPDDRILLGAGEQGIKRISANGGTAETVIKVAAGETAHGPHLFPDGDHILFTVTRAIGDARWDKAQIVVQSIRTGERRVVIDGGSDARYLPAGQIVYALGANLFAAQFDTTSLKVTGGSVPVLEGVARANAGNTAAAFFGFSSNGALAYFAGNGTIGRPTWGLAVAGGAGGTVEPLPVPPAIYLDPAVSPDGKHLAIGIDSDTGDSQIWIYDLAGAGAPRRLTFSGRVNVSPAWTADGRRIVFISNRDDRNAIYSQAADGTGSAERLTDPKVVQPSGNASLHVSKSGIVIFRIPGGDGDIWMLQLAGDRTPKPLVEGPGNQYGGALSPDGRWLAYASGEAGRTAGAIYVQPFPATGAKYQIAASGAGQPVWSPDGARIYFGTANPNNVFYDIAAVDIRTQTGFAYANPVAITKRAINVGNRPFTVMPDGRVMFLQSAETATAAQRIPNPEIRVTLNWFEELKQRVPR